MGEIESFFLQFSFDDTHSNTGATIDRDIVHSEKAQFTVIQALRSKLEHNLLSVAEQLFNCYSPDVSIAGCTREYECQKQYSVCGVFI